MSSDAASETVQLLDDLSRRAAELAAALPALDLDAEDLAALAGEVQRINARLADAEVRLAFRWPGEEQTTEVAAELPECAVRSGSCHVPWRSSSEGAHHP